MTLLPCDVSLNLAALRQLAVYLGEPDAEVRLSLHAGGLYLEVLFDDGRTFASGETGQSTRTLFRKVSEQMRAALAAQEHQETRRWPVRATTA